MKLTKQLLERWHKVPEPKRILILKNLGITLNYGVNGILLSIPIYIFLYLIFDSSIKTYFLLVLAMSFLLAYLEHYYLFLRENWKKQL